MTLTVHRILSLFTTLAISVLLLSSLVLNIGCANRTQHHQQQLQSRSQWQSSARPVQHQLPPRVQLNDPTLPPAPTIGHHAQPASQPSTSLIELNEPRVVRPESIAFSNSPQRQQPESRGSRPVIGVYGELVSNTMADVQRSDGADNLWRITNVTEGAVFDPHVSRDGEKLVFASTMHSETADLYVKSVAGSTITKLTNDPSHNLMPSFSPDGKYIAFASNRSGSWNIYYMATEGGRPVQLTNDHDHELHPSWSPDGRMLAYCKYNAQSARWEIWSVDIEKPGVSNFLVYGLFPQWNPDPGRPKIAFQRARQRGSRYHSIWTVDYINGEAKFETEIVSAANAATINPSWSPDGSRIVFVTVVDPDIDPGERPEQSDVWVIDVNGNNRTALTTGEFSNYQPVWARNGSVYFVSNRSGTDNVWAVSAGPMHRIDQPDSGGQRGIVQVNPEQPN